MRRYLSMWVSYVQHHRGTEQQQTTVLAAVSTSGKYALNGSFLPHHVYWNNVGNKRWCVVCVRCFPRDALPCPVVFGIRPIFFCVYVRSSTYDWRPI